MKTNRNFKDSVFTALFSEPAILRDLYNALGGVSLPADVPVSINTLDNVVFKYKPRFAAYIIIFLSLADRREAWIYTMIFHSK